MNIELRKLDPAVDGIPGWFAHPQAPGARPAVMMLHHAPGLTGDYKYYAADLAKRGYSVLVPSIYNMLGVEGEHHHTQGAAIQAKHSDADFLAVIDRAWRWLCDRPETDAARTAALGHCMGGRFAIPFAADHPALAALILFYASIREEPVTAHRPRHSFDTARLVRCPTLVFYGGVDYVTANRTQQGLYDAFLQGGTPVEWHFFARGNHGFGNHDSAGYQPALAETSWGLVVEFLGRQLRV